MAVDKGKRSSGRRTFFWRGFIANILNPKAAVFYIAVFPAFIEASGNIFGQTIGLTIIYVTIATAIHCLIVALAGTAHGFFNHPVRFLVARRVMSLLLVAVAFWFAFETKMKFDQPIS
jgi:threonine/homoserine/homoserine lactone efflux protein